MILIQVSDAPLVGIIVGSAIRRLRNVPSVWKGIELLVGIVLCAKRGPVPVVIRV